MVVTKNYIPDTINRTEFLPYGVLALPLRWGEVLRVMALLPHDERNQMKWLGHPVRMTLGCLPGEVFWACPTTR